MIRAQADSVTTISVKEGKLPPYTEVRSPTPSKFKHQSLHVPEPFVYRAEPAPKPKISNQPKQVHTTSPSLHSKVVSVTLLQLNRLQQKKGGFFRTLLGGGKSPLEEIRDRTGVRIRVDTAQNIIHVTGKTSQVVQRAISEIQREM